MQRTTSSKVLLPAGTKGEILTRLAVRAATSKSVERRDSVTSTEAIKFPDRRAVSERHSVTKALKIANVTSNDL